MSIHSEKSSLSSDLTGETAEKLSTSKRTMLKFAWTAPLIMTIALPTSSFASNVSGWQGSDGKDKDRDRDNDKHEGKHKGTDKHIGNNGRRGLE